jgi:hypothetical protein
MAALVPVKTTFLSTLPHFYEGVHVTPILDTTPLLEVPNEITRREQSPQSNHVYVLLDRDNPTVSSDEMRTFFEAIRRLFRTPEGRVVVLWPITDESAANALSGTAWDIGADSIVDASTKGLYRFTGLPKVDYFDVADITTRSLNRGQSLEAFGLGSDVTAPLLQDSDTISQFYGHLEARSQEINNTFGDTVKDRKIPSIWILVGGDDNRELSLTVATLTQGTEKRVDIDRMLAVLDTPDSNTVYLEDWRKRRHEVAYLLRRLDVRLFELPPNVTVASIRAFGDEATKARLREGSDVPANASKAVQAALFFRILAGQHSSGAATIRSATDETANEYRRVQTIASKNDKPLNKALAAAIERALQDVGVTATVAAEQRRLDVNSNLQPDILVEFVDGRLVCLEPTWRTTGTELPEELPEQQSSMTVGHIQQYLLAKVLEYLKDLGL